MQDDVNSKQKWEDPLHTNEACMEQARLLESETTAIFNKPPPKPEEPKKAEDAKAGAEPAQATAGAD